MIKSYWQDEKKRKRIRCQEGEFIVSEFLKDTFVKYETEYKFQDLFGPKGGQLRFDFALFRNNELYCLLEFQGSQHYDPNADIGGDQRSNNDNAKREYCAKRGIRLYEIRWDEDVYGKLIQILSDMYVRD